MFQEKDTPVSIVKFLFLFLFVQLVLVNNYIFTFIEERLSSDWRRDENY